MTSNIIAQPLLNVPHPFVPTTNYNNTSVVNNSIYFDSNANKIKNNFLSIITFQILFLLQQL
jgi:hypothetical protein